MHEITLLHSEILTLTTQKFPLAQLISKQKRGGKKRPRSGIYLVAALHLQPVPLPGIAVSSCTSMTTSLMHRSGESKHAPPPQACEGLHTARDTLQPQSRQAGMCLQRTGKEKPKGTSFNAFNIVLNSTK